MKEEDARVLIVAAFRAWTRHGPGAEVEERQRQCIKRKTIMTAEADERRISEKAYHLWMAEGRPQGRDLEHWKLAQELIAKEKSPGPALHLPLPNASAKDARRPSKRLRGSKDDRRKP
jgi:Protein of unknown function (DUF2934)